MTTKPVSIKPKTNNQVLITYILSKGGQTLVELLVALTLITLFLSGVVLVQLIAIRNTQYAQKRSYASKIAREQLERVRVVRDSSGIAALEDNGCISNCYINDKLTPAAIIPTGVYTTYVELTDPGSQCILPPEADPNTSKSYMATAVVNWGQGDPNITPAPELSLSTCITDWR